MFVLIKPITTPLLEINLVEMTALSAWTDSSSTSATSLEFITGLKYRCQALFFCFFQLHHLLEPHQARREEAKMGVDILRDILREPADDVTRQALDWNLQEKRRIGSRPEEDQLRARQRQLV